MLFVCVTITITFDSTVLVELAAFLAVIEKGCQPKSVCHRLFHTLSDLGKVLEGNVRWHDVFDAAVDLVGKQFDEAFFAQRLQSPMYSCTRQIGRDVHSLHDSYLHTSLPDRAEHI